MQDTNHITWDARPVIRFGVERGEIVTETLSKLLQHIELSEDISTQDNASEET